MYENIPFGPNAQAIKLPVNGSEVPGNWEVDTILTGWGYNDTLVLPVTLQKVTLKVVSFEECYFIHQNKTIEPIEIYETNICVGVKGGGKSECGGDYGSPTILTDGTQIGVVSWSLRPCNNNKYPNVMTKVSHYREWIRSVTGV